MKMRNVPIARLGGCLSIALVFIALTAQGGAAQCEQCNEDYIGGIKFHEFGLGDGHEFTCGPNGCHSEWVEFFCDSHVHESCDPDEDLDELQVLFAAVSGDEEHLRELLGENRESVLLNLGRNAIQLIGCDGHVDLHVQLDPGLVARLKLKN